jgi:hypothetical protein
MRIRERGEQNCSLLLFVQFWVRLPRDLCGEAGLSPGAIAASTLGGNGLRLPRDLCGEGGGRLQPRVGRSLELIFSS